MYKELRTTALYITIISLLLVSCGGDPAAQYDTSLINNPNSADGSDSDAKLPVITFDTDMHDFGRLQAGENISYSFHFVNSGHANLVISACDASCGCTVADFPRDPITPGRDGYVTVSFKSAGMSGQQYKEVTVCTNAQPSRTKLKIQAKVI